MRYCNPRFMLIVALIVLLSCSGKQNPVQSENGLQTNAVDTTSTDGSGRYLLGLWEISISEDHCSAEIVPVRQVEDHLNVIKFLEQAPCTDCLKVYMKPKLATGELDASLMLTHPYKEPLSLTGFDVRGIFITNGDKNFPVSNRTIAWGKDIPHIMNAAGYTSLFNPVEFPENGPQPPILKYTKGKMAIGSGFTATLNPYVAYLYWLERAAFLPSYGALEDLIIRPPIGAFKFGYAIDASWMKATGPINDPIKDFPPEANCPEAYKIDGGICGEMDPAVGSSLPIWVDVYDRQGLSTIESVSFECPGLFAGAKPLYYLSQPGPEIFRYSGEITNELGAGYGEYPVLVRVTDTAVDNNLGHVDAWDVFPFSINKGWVKTLRGGDIQGNCIDFDSQGNLFLGGRMADKCDMDPGCETAWLESYDSGSFASYLAKYTSEMEYQWAVTWGSSPAGWVNDISVDWSGNVYAVGVFTDSVDFDPGPGEDIHSSADWYDDAFLAKFSLDGDFQWARTWGGNGSESARSVVVSSDGNVYVAGDCGDSTDLNPGPGILEGFPNGVFLSKFSPDGNFNWSRSWGDPDGWGPSTSDMAVDSSDFIYIYGDYWKVVDFDPGSGTDIHETNGMDDFFLQKFDSNGSFIWAKTWGGTDSDYGAGVAVDGNNDIVVTGEFRGEVDFDPGPGQDIHTGGSEGDACMSKFLSNGDLAWANTWADFDVYWSMPVDADSQSLVSTCWVGPNGDMDPGPGESLNDNDNSALCLVKLALDGSFQWGRAWIGVTDLGQNLDVEIGPGDNTYVSGLFDGRIDFDPGPFEYWVNADMIDAFVSFFPPDGNW